MYEGTTEGDFDGQDAWATGWGKFRSGKAFVYIMSTDCLLLRFEIFY